MNNLEFQAYGSLADDSPFGEIFPFGIVTLKSINPIILADSAAPLCYVLDPDALTQTQILLLAKKILKTWNLENQDLDFAIERVKTGLPLDARHFSAVATNYKSFASKQNLNK